MLDWQGNSPRPSLLGHGTPEAGCPNPQETLFKKTAFPSHLDCDVRPLAAALFQETNRKGRDLPNQGFSRPIFGGPENGPEGVGVAAKIGLGFPCRTKTCHVAPKKVLLTTSGVPIWNRDSIHHYRIRLQDLNNFAVI